MINRFMSRMSQASSMKKGFPQRRLLRVKTAARMSRGHLANSTYPFAAAANAAARTPMEDKVTITSKTAQGSVSFSLFKLDKHNWDDFESAVQPLLDMEGLEFVYNPEAEPTGNEAAKKKKIDRALFLLKQVVCKALQDQRAFEEAVKKPAGSEAVIPEQGQEAEEAEQKEEKSTPHMLWNYYRGVCNGEAHDDQEVVRERLTNLRIGDYEGLDGMLEHLFKLYQQLKNAGGSMAPATIESTLIRAVRSDPDFKSVTQAYTQGKHNNNGQIDIAHLIRMLRAEQRGRDREETQTSFRVQDEYMTEEDSESTLVVRGDRGDRGNPPPTNKGKGRWKQRANKQGKRVSFQKAGQATKPQACWNFRDEGKCQWGDDCKFSHEPQEEVASLADQVEELAFSAFDNDVFGETTTEVLDNFDENNFALLECNYPDNAQYQYDNNAHYQYDNNAQYQYDPAEFQFDSEFVKNYDEFRAIDDLGVELGELGEEAGSVARALGLLSLNNEEKNNVPFEEEESNVPAFEEEEEEKHDRQQDRQQPFVLQNEQKGGENIFSNQQKAKQVENILSKPAEWPAADRVVSPNCDASSEELEFQPRPWTVGPLGNLHCNLVGATPHPECECKRPSFPHQTKDDCQYDCEICENQGAGTKKCALCEGLDSCLGCSRYLCNPWCGRQWDSIPREDQQEEDNDVYPSIPGGTTRFGVYDQTLTSFADELDVSSRSLQGCRLTVRFHQNDNDHVNKHGEDEPTWKRHNSSVLESMLSYQENEVDNDPESSDDDEYEYLPMSPRGPKRVKLSQE